MDSIEIVLRIIEYVETLEGKITPRKSKELHEVNIRRIVIYYIWLNGLSQTKISKMFKYSDPSAVNKLCCEFESWLFYLKDGDNPRKDYYLELINILKSWKLQ